MVARWQSYAPAAQRRRSSNFYRLLSHRVPRYAAAPAGFVRQRCEREAGDRQDVLSRASGTRSARKAAAAAPEGGRHAGRPEGPVAVDDRISIHFSSAFPPRPAAVGNRNRLAKARGREESCWHPCGCFAVRHFARPARAQEKTRRRGCGIVICELSETD